MNKILYPLSFLSIPLLFAGTLLVAVGVKGDPMNLSLAGVGALVMLFAALTMPRPGHPVHVWLTTKSSKLQPATVSAEPAVPAQIDSEALELLQPMVQHNMDVVNYEPTQQDYHTERVRADLVIGPSADARSWIGGLPRMPDDVLWPEHNGMASMFMAQIAMEDLPSGIWDNLGPRTGWLLFFWGGTDAGDATVMHIDELGPERTYPGYEAVAGFLSQEAWASLNVLGRNAIDGFVPPKWGLRMSAIGEDAPALPDLFDKMALPESPVTKLKSVDFSTAPFQSLFGNLSEPPESYVVSFLAREIYSRDPNALDPVARQLFESLWTFEAQYEVCTLGGPVSQEYPYTVTEEPVVLMEFPVSHLTGFTVGSAGFGFFIKPEDLKAGRFDKAWLDHKN